MNSNSSHVFRSAAAGGVAGILVASLIAFGASMEKSSSAGQGSPEPATSSNSATP